MNKSLLRASENFFINKTSKHLYNARGNYLDVLQVKTMTHDPNLFTLIPYNLWMEFLPKKSQHKYITYRSKLYKHKD